MHDVKHSRKNVIYEFENLMFSEQMITIVKARNLIRDNKEGWEIIVRKTSNIIYCVFF